METGKGMCVMMFIYTSIPTLSFLLWAKFVFNCLPPIVGQLCFSNMSMGKLFLLIVECHISLGVICQQLQMNSDGAEFKAVWPKQKTFYCCSHPLPDGLTEKSKVSFRGLTVKRSEETKLNVICRNWTSKLPTFILNPPKKQNNYLVLKISQEITLYPWIGI